MSIPITGVLNSLQQSGGSTETRDAAVPFSATREHQSPTFQDFLESEWNRYSASGFNDSTPGTGYSRASGLSTSSSFSTHESFPNEVPLTVNTPDSRAFSQPELNRSGMSDATYRKLDDVMRQEDAAVSSSEKKTNSTSPEGGKREEANGAQKVSSERQTLEDDARIKSRLANGSRTTRKDGQADNAAVRGSLKAVVKNASVTQNTKHGKQVNQIADSAAGEARILNARKGVQKSVDNISARALNSDMNSVQGFLQSFFVQQSLRVLNAGDGSENGQRDSSSTVKGRKTANTAAIAARDESSPAPAKTTNPKIGKSALHPGLNLKDHVLVQNQGKSADRTEVHAGQTAGRKKTFQLTVNDHRTKPESVDQLQKDIQNNQNRTEGFQVVRETSDTGGRVRTFEVHLPEGKSLSQGVKGDIGTQLVKNTAITLKDSGMGDLRLVLRPDGLGSVRVMVRLHDNVLNGRIIVDSQQAYDAFKSGLDSLQQAFKSEGFDVGDIEIALSQQGGKQGSSPDAEGRSEEGLYDPLPMNRIRNFEKESRTEVSEGYVWGNIDLVM